MSLDKFIGCIVRIVYIDRNNRITERIIQIYSIREGMVRAYCLTSRGPRVFRVENILAAEAVVRHHVV